MSGNIRIKNRKGPVAVIEIEGVIGVPEQRQFDRPGDRVATYETFRSSVKALAKLNAREIIVNIRSTGGNVNDAMLIHDTLAELDARITTRCYGYVASAATVIAQAASPGCREISSNSLYLIHKSVCTAEGNRDDLSKTMGMLDQTDQRIASVYAARSGKPAEHFAELMCENNGNGRWLSPEEVLGYALADRIIASAALPDDASQTVINMGLPPVPDKETENMNFSKQWNAVLELLGIRDTKNAGNADNVGSAAKYAAAGEAGQAAGENIDADNSNPAAGNSGNTVNGGTGNTGNGNPGTGSPAIAYSAIGSSAAGNAIAGNPAAGNTGSASAGRSPLAQQTLESMALAQTEMSEAHLAQIETLRNRIGQLEAINSRLRAGATATQPKEDPAHQDAQRTPNEEAYLADVRRFI